MALHPKIVYQGEYKIGTYDIDCHKRLTIPAMTKLMHEAAMQNVLDLKLSYWDLIPHQISWVLMRKRLEIIRQPELGEKIKIETHPAGFEKYFTYRDFKIFDNKDQLIATASSTWLLMDTVKRRMASIPSFIRDFEMPKKEFLSLPEKKITQINESQFKKTFQVGWFELDWNEHLNNLHYIVKMLDVLPVDIHLEKKLKRLDLIYKLECKYNDIIISNAQKVDHSNQYVHNIIHKETGKEVALGKSYWE